MLSDYNLTHKKLPMSALQPVGIKFECMPDFPVFHIVFLVLSAWMGASAPLLAVEYTHLRSFADIVSQYILQYINTLHQYPGLSSLSAMRMYARRTSISRLENLQKLSP